MVEAEGVTAAFKHLTFTPVVTFNRVTGNDTNENEGVAANGKMIAMSWKSTSTVAVFNSETPLTFDANVPLIKGHMGAIYDMQWSPFEDRLLATCADDGKVKMWVFDDYDGLTNKSDVLEADMNIDAHHRKCISVRWH